MNVTESVTASAKGEVSSAGTANVPIRDPGHRPRRRPGKLIGGLALLAVVLVPISLFVTYPDRASRLLSLALASDSRDSPGPEVAPPDPAPPPWDGRIVLAEGGKRGLGLATARVEHQTRPIQIELLGTTKYDEDSLTKIRPMFKARVDKVSRTVGQIVKKGDPLIDLYSKELAEAKSVYEIERIQWIYDLNLLNARRELRKSSAISEQLFLESQNNEMKSRRESEVARDKLLVFGLTEGEVEGIDREVGTQKARMTLRSPSDGIVVERDVVPGNLYDENDTLLVIAPLNHLWVWGNVFESEQDLVRLGQDWEIRFPFLDRSLQGKVEYISNRVDPSTHAVRIRTSIPNPDGRLKSDMLVRGTLSIPPVPGRVVIPRTALVVSGGKPFAFVKRPGLPVNFERHPVVVVQEKHDFAVLEGDLREGQEVVTMGGLVLNQIHEENELAHAHLPGTVRKAAE